MDAFHVNVRTKRIFTASIDIEALKKLFQILKGLNEEALKQELVEYEERVKKDNPRLSAHEFKRNKDNITELYCISIELFDTKGGYLRFYKAEEILNEKSFPDDVSSIQFRNTSLFQAQREYVQSYQISVDLDFSKVSFGGMNANVSNETLNNSRINVIGINESWVEGASKKIEDFIKPRKNNRGWIHKRDVYAFIMWLIIIPIAFWNLVKIDNLIRDKLLKLSGIFTTFLYIYYFVIVIMLSNLLFKYARWLYPPVELKTNINDFQKVQRAFLYALLFGLFIKIALDLISFLSLFLF